MNLNLCYFYEYIKKLVFHPSCNIWNMIHINKDSIFSVEF